MLAGDLLLVNGECYSSDPVEACPSRPWGTGMADSMVAPVEGLRALLRSWGLGR